MINQKYIFRVLLSCICIVNSALAYNAQETTEFAGCYSSAMENKNSIAKDAGIPGFIGPDGRGSCAAGENDETPSGELANNHVNPVFKQWANTYFDYVPSPAADVNLIGNEVYSPLGGVPDMWRTPEEALGAVTGDNFHVCVLGDLWASQLAVLDPAAPDYINNQLLEFNDPNKIQPGSIVLGFEFPIQNGPGPDFAVFENGFISAGGAGVSGQIFAELAFVEVSTDGTHFARFPNVSLTEPLTESGGTGPYGTIDPSNVYNLAGKHVNAYESSWGTPFNLNDLENNPDVINGLVDINNINYIRIIDIPGNGFFSDSASSLIDPNSINSETGLEGVYYTSNNEIHDAWVTWGSGGHDLEAIGVIEQIYGDADSDGKVDLKDFARLKSRWKKHGYWPQGDFDENGIINENDLALLAMNWLYEIQ